MTNYNRVKIKWATKLLFLSSSPPDLGRTDAKLQMRYHFLFIKKKKPLKIANETVARLLATGEKSK